MKPGKNCDAVFVTINVVRHSLLGLVNEEAVKKFRWSVREAPRTARLVRSRDGLSACKIFCFGIRKSNCLSSLSSAANYTSQNRNLLEATDNR